MIYELNFIVSDLHKNLRLYYWVPRTEVVYIQAVLDAYEGLARLRTERHDGDRSYIMCLVQESRRAEFDDVMQHLEPEIIGQVIFDSKSSLTV